MTPAPDIGATWLTVSDFIDRVALDSAQTEFPVVGPGGSLAGVTGVRRLARVPPTSRSITALQQVIAVVPPVYIASPEDPATLLLSRPALSGDLAAIVLTAAGSPAS